MQTNRILIASLVLSLVFNSCVEDNDYTVPESLGDEENKKLSEILGKVEGGEIELKTIPAVRALIKKYDAKQIISEILVKGYVSSSDRTGNFYKEFFIQDSVDNPTASLKIKINQTHIYNKFNIGREVYVYLKGMYIDEENTGDGVIIIGGRYDNFDDDILDITPSQIDNHLFRTDRTLALTPLELNLSQVSSEHIGIYVKLVDIQFPIDLENQSYVDPDDYFDTERAVESCTDNATFILETSTFASFSDRTLPTQGSGNILGIINKTYDGKQLVINLNSADDVKMDKPRCNL